MAILNNSNAISSGGYDINNSLRLRRSASAYLNRTPASAGNRKTWTWSGWVKRGELLTTEDYDFFAAGASDGATFRFSGGASHTIRIYDFGGSFFMNLITTQVFRDPSAWYHIVLAVDSTQATSSNRVKLYVNGTQVTAFSTAVYPSLNQDCAYFNNNVIHNIGRNPWGPGQYYDGYLTEVNFIDGQALTPSSFGETDTTTGSWKPKAYSGTYGTNGFYLKFSDIATTSGSNAGLGKDFSGNANYYNTNNISVTAGSTYDAMIDSPTLTSATVANYCTANPLDKVSSDSTSQGNLLVTVNGGAASGVRCNTVNFTSITGKWYWEGTVTNSGSGRTMFSMKAEPCNISSGVSSLTWYWRADGVTNLTGAGTFTTNDVIMFAYDSDTGKMWAGKNGTWLNSGVPASGTGQVTTLTALAAYALALSCDTGGAGTGAVSFNYGQQPFAYTPPTGFNRVNTYNLPDSTIKKGNTVMDATLYTGTGASLAITNAGAFKPDLVWVKGRSGATDHAWYDSVRGTTKDLVSNSTAAETTQTTGLTAFGTGGFTVGALAKLNTSAATYVGWQWQGGQGTNTSNTSGSITSTVSVNATAGFSVVTYTGNATQGATVGHGLGVVPKMIIFKARNSVQEWDVYHASVCTTNNLYLSLTTTAALASGGQTRWNLASFSSSVFGLGIHAEVNGNTNTYVAYCWAEIAGFSKFGSYTGNGSADGPFVFTGFRPKFIMIKRTDAVESWEIFDTTRSSYNTAVELLEANSSGAESTSAGNAIDVLSNGFKQRNTRAATNASGGTYIYMAFAENPLKNSLAR